MFNLENVMFTVGNDGFTYLYLLDLLVTGIFAQDIINGNIMYMKNLYFFVFFIIGVVSVSCVKDMESSVPTSPSEISLWTVSNELNEPVGIKIYNVNLADPNSIYSFDVQNMNEYNLGLVSIMNCDSLDVSFHDDNSMVRLYTLDVPIKSLYHVTNWCHAEGNSFCFIVDNRLKELAKVR